MATYNNEVINIAIDGEVLFNVTNGQDEWNSNTTYNKGDSIRVKIKGVNYYFVSKVNGNSGKAPPNENFWVADQCSKTIEVADLDGQKPRTRSSRRAAAFWWVPNF